MFRNIAFRLLFPLLLILFSSMSIAAYVIYENNKTTISETMLNDMESIVSITKNNLSYWMREQVATAKTLAANQSLIEFLKNPKNETLLNRIENNLHKFYHNAGFYENISVVVKLENNKYIERKSHNETLKVYNGKRIIDTLEGTTLKEHPAAFESVEYALKKGELKISKPYPSPKTKNPIVAIVVPIKSSKEILGALILEIKLSYFVEKYVQNIDIAQRGFIAAVDSNGDVIIHKNRDFILKKNIKETPFGKEILRNEKLTGKFTLNGKKVYIDSQKDSVTSWYIVGHIFEETIKAKQHEFALKLVAILFIITLVFTFLLYITINTIVLKPLKDISNRLEEFSVDNFQVLDDFETSIYEFSRIKESFNDATHLLSMSYLDLKYSQELSRSVLNSIDALIFYKNENLKYIGFNTQFVEFLGKDESEILGSTDFELFDEDIAKKSVEADLDVLQNHRSIIRVTTAHIKNGKELILQEIKSLLRDSHGNVIGVVGVAYDITKQKELEKLIEHQAYYDTLTELPNRAFLHEYFEKNLAVAQREKKKLAVLFMDLDHFKYINDTFGHDVGDEVLKILSSRFNSITRKSDMISRLGGDEFVIIYNNYTSMENLLLYANRLIDLATQECIVGEHSFLLSISIGISIYPEHGHEAVTLMKHADTAMYKAKEMGRNNIQFYDITMGKVVSEEMAMLNSIRSAIDNGEFFLVYQPQIDAKTLSLIGAEALVRWNSKDFGLLYPDTFIPISESTGMILPLGEWILLEACKQQVQWKKEYGVSIKIAVNVSIRQFQHKRFIETVQKCIQESAIEPDKLELEITEGISMKDVNKSLTILQELKKLGVSLSIDDFGTGYSSLAYLKKFPIDRLKIDKSFVLDSLKTKDDRVLIQTIITIAKGLGIESVAEGVEDMEHVELLKKLSCDIFQGYYFDKPLKSDAFIEKYFKKS